MNIHFAAAGQSRVVWWWGIGVRRCGRRRKAEPGAGGRWKGESKVGHRLSHNRGWFV